MLSLKHITTFNEKFNLAQSKLGNIFSRLADRYGLYGLKSFWDENFHKTGTSIRPNAFMFGLVINDWDKSFRSRNVKIKTTDLQIPFQYIESIPEWKKEASYQEFSEFLGRFEPINIYSHSSAQVFQIVLYYIAEARYNTDLRTYWTLERIESIVKRLQSLVFPVYTDGFMPPMKVLFNIGNIYRSIPVIITNISINNEPPYDIETGLSMLKKITLDMKVSYPLWQAISGDIVFTTKAGSQCFMFQELSNQYTQVYSTKRSVGGITRYHG